MRYEGNGQSVKSLRKEYVNKSMGGSKMQCLLLMLCTFRKNSMGADNILIVCAHFIT